MKKLISLNLLIALISFCFISCGNQSKKSLSNDNLENSPISKNGKYLSYEYTLMEKDNKTAVLFPHFLPRNDIILIGAINHLILEIYNEIIPASSKPTIESRDGVNLLKINGNESDYYILINKEDTGEVNSLIIWGEIK